MTRKNINIVYDHQALEICRFSEDDISTQNHGTIKIKGNYPDEENRFIITLKNTHTCENELTISLFPEHYSLSPTVLFLEARSLLVISHSSELVFIDTNGKRIVRLCDLSYPVYYFFFSKEIDGFITVHELGINAYDTEGNTLWKWSSPEIVTKSEPVGKKIQITLFDESRHEIELTTGNQSAIKSEHF